VVGLARSGTAAVRALHARGEEVVGVDAGAPAGLDELSEAGVELLLQTDGLRELERARAVVKSPGVPAEAPAIARARAEGIPVLGDLELAWRLLPNEFIAVTGTNGKTTTVELIGHIHRQADLPVAVAGNVGTALSSLVGELDARATVVCEASSFQLEDTIAFAPEAAVLLNLTPDHINRHGTMAAYTAAKLKLVGLRGEHNRQNAMAAAAVCLARGIDPEAVRAGLRTFAGVPHRLEEVASREGVLYVNDSKATNVASTLVALRAFPDAPVHLILGGQGKGQDFADLRSAVEQSCRAVYLIGEDARLIAQALDGAGVAVHACGTLEQALQSAGAAAAPGDVVLLSPGCASFDQYADFEARGERFRGLANR
jgi:UDP-N-acetylmuramoylalanine--D-glutamate ligase